MQMPTKIMDQNVVKMSSRGLKMMIIVQYAPAMMMLMMMRMVIALLGPEVTMKLVSWLVELTVGQLSRGSNQS